MCSLLLWSRVAGQGWLADKEKKKQWKGSGNFKIHRSLEKSRLAMNCKSFCYYPKNWGKHPHEPLNNDRWQCISTSPKPHSIASCMRQIKLQRLIPHSARGVAAKDGLEEGHTAEDSCSHATLLLPPKKEFHFLSSCHELFHLSNEHE